MRLSLGQEYQVKELQNKAMKIEFMPILFHMAKPNHISGYAIHHRPNVGYGFQTPQPPPPPHTGMVLQAPTSEAVKCQAVVDALTIHLSPHVTLEHIRGEDLAAYDTMAIQNLLDIFSVLFHLPVSTAVAAGTGDEEEEDSSISSELNDSNVISAEGRCLINYNVHTSINQMYPYKQALVDYALPLPYYTRRICQCLCTID